MKNFTKLTIAACALFFSTNAIAQRINAAAGLNFSNMMLQYDAGQIAEPKIKVGFHVGATGDYEVTDLIAVDAGLLFSTMGYKANTDAGFAQVEGKVSLYYLTIPILAKFNFEVADIQAFAGVGPYIGIGLAGNQKSTTTVFGTETKSDEKIEWGEENSLNRFDFGLQAKAGVEFDKISVAFFYGLGLTNISNVDADGYSAKNSVFGITAGYTLFEL